MLLIFLVSIPARSKYEAKQCRAISNLNGADPMDTQIIKTGQPWILIINFKIQYAEKHGIEFLILKMIVFHKLDGYLPIQSTK